MPVTLTARPVSRTAVTEVYDDLAEDIHRTATKFAVRYNQDQEECVADAQLIFMQAYRSYDPSKGRLSTRVAIMVWNRLLDKLRQKVCRFELRKKGHLAVRAIMSDREYYRTTSVLPGSDKMERSQRRMDELYNVPAAPEPRPFDLLDWVTDLSEDAETVVRLALEGVSEIADALGDSEHPSEPGTVRTAIRKVLRAAGWPAKRIADAMREIGDAL